MKKLCHFINENFIRIHDTYFTHTKGSTKKLIKLVSK